MSERTLRFGVVGLSRGFDLMRGAFQARPRCQLVAAADPRPEAREAFAREFSARVHLDAQSLCSDSDVAVVYVATPHELHAEHAMLAARHGKHVLVEKPMAMTLADCDAMADAAGAAGVALIVGPSHSFDPPIEMAAAMIASGAYGPLRMITAVNFTDFLYRPRRPEELASESGGVVISQGVHHIDVLRRLAGAEVESVFAHTKAWDPARPVEGAYQALLRFRNGVSASLTYSGYARYDTDALMGWIGETGRRRAALDYGQARGALAAAPEAELKRRRAYQGPAAAEPDAHEHFGWFVASCELADLRPTAEGVEVYGDASRSTIEAPMSPTSRERVLDEVWAAVAEKAAPLHDAAWGRANLAVCLAMLTSAREGRSVDLAELERQA